MTLKYFKAFVETGNKSLYVDTIGVFEEDITAEYMSGLAGELLRNECRLILFPAKENDEQGEEQNDQGCFCGSCTKQNCEQRKIAAQYNRVVEQNRSLQGQISDLNKQKNELRYFVYQAVGGVLKECGNSYATDPQSVSAFLNSLKRDGVEIGHHIWECACGQGHISQVLKEYGYDVISTDIKDRGYGTPYTDFLTTEKFMLGRAEKQCDILTNPPYKFAEDFTLKGLELLEDGRKLILYVKDRFLEGESRFKKIFSKYPPKYIYAHVLRQKCAKDGDFETHCKNAGSLFYMWVIWEKGYTGEAILRWIYER